MLRLPARFFALAALSLGLSCTVDDVTFTEGDDPDAAQIDAVTDVTLTITISGNSNGTVVSNPAGIDCGTTCEVTVPAGTTVTLSASPDANTDFTGWSGGGCSGTGTCEITVDADVTVDAAFDLMRYTLDVELNGNGTGTVESAPTGIDCGSDCTEDFDHGTSVTLTATAGSGQTFVGWTGGGCSGTGTCVVDLTADTTVTASFALNNSVVVSKDGTGEGRVTSNPIGIDCGTDCSEAYAPSTMVTLTAAPIGDAAFTGWAGAGCSGTGTCVVTVTDAVLVTATFTQNQHTLSVMVGGTGTGTVASNPTGIDCPGDCSEPYDSGASVTLTATPTLGQFVGWSGGGGCTGTAPCTVVVSAATSVTATFNQITVVDVTSTTANGAYSTGSGIVVQVVFSDPVIVTGTPTITLNSGAAPVPYASGSGTNTLVFGYTVAAGQASADLDYVSSSALALAGGTIRNAVGNDATLTLPAPGGVGSLGFNKNIVIDAIAPTTISATSSTPNGSYNASQTISIQVSFSEAVTVVGTPTLALNTGGTATFASGSGTSILSFTYDIAPGENTGDLDYASTTPISLAGGTIRDAVGNTAVLTLPAPGAMGSIAFAKALVVDTTVPVVTNVTSSTANGSYASGATISIQVVFSENVTVASGTPTLGLNTGGTATYASGTGTATLTFTYTVGAGQNTGDLDYAMTGSLGLGGGTIRDAAANNATLTLAAPGAPTSLGANKALVIDTASPVVSSVTSSTNNGLYGIGSAISIQVTFSEAVTVTGTPQLGLSSGGTASYTSGSGTATLAFTYTVANGNAAADLDYATSGSLTLNGGMIRDGVLNSATLTLPAPGSAQSLGGSKNIGVDGIPPVVSAITGASGFVASTNAMLTFTVTETNLGVTTCTQTVGTGTQVSCGNTGASYGALSQGAHTITITHTDLAGNVSTASTASWTVDTIAPVIGMISGPASPSTSTSATLLYTITEANPGTTSCNMTSGTGTQTGCTVAMATYTGLSTGAHVVTVGHTDLAGNSASPTQSFNWSVCPTTSFLPATTGTTFTVPSGCGTQMDVYAWGGGGGGGHYSGGAGGGGGFVSGTLTVAAGQTYTIAVGGGGGAGASGTANGGGGLNGGGAGGDAGGVGGNAAGGGGGGWSGVYSGTTYYIIAAGGGGGGGNINIGGPGGGAAGGATGATGGADNGGTGGVGGTQLAGGAGGAGGNGGTSGTNGASRQGGTGGTGTSGGAGGGGAGHFGGGGGGAFSGGGGGGGGGGSSFYLAASVLNGTTQGGAGSTPGGTTNANYLAGRGVGGTSQSSGATAGSAGLVVIHVHP